MGHIITIVDYGRSNLLSVQRGFEYWGNRVNYAQTAEEILAAKALVLPGVGAFDDSMALLHQKGLSAAICEKAAQGTAIFGICLGLQMFFEESAEGGKQKGLGLLAGKVEPLPPTDTEGNPLAVPSIGWHSITPCPAPGFGELLPQQPAQGQYYFVHSYHAVPKDTSHVAAFYLYGGHKICAAVAKDNLFATQFHPEKSGKVGLQLIRRFCQTLPPR